LLKYESLHLHNTDAPMGAHVVCYNCVLYYSTAGLIKRPQPQVIRIS